MARSNRNKRLTHPSPSRRGGEGRGAAYPAAGKPRRRRDRPAAGEEGGGDWLYGRHPVLAALSNPNRRVRRLLLTREAERRLGERLAEACRGTPPRPEIVERAVLESLLPSGAVHQGIALNAESPPEVSLAEVCRRTRAAESSVVVLLDRVTDPQNVGAVLRSAAAFGAIAVVLQRHHAPPASGALAKAASGALEAVPLVRVANLARALAELKETGFWCVGLDPHAKRTLAETAPKGRVALVLGAEDRGLRRITREACDELARIPIREPVDSLNVAAASAVALYEVARGGGP